MAKLRGNDVLTVLRGLNAVSRAAANITEAELREAWTSSSTISGLRNLNINCKPENFSEQVKEASERSFAVAKGLKEYSLISAQRLISKSFDQPTIPSNSDVQPTIKEFVDPTYNDLHTVPDIPVEETLTTRSNFYTVTESGIPIPSNSDVQPAIKEFVDPSYNDLHTIPDIPVEETPKTRSNSYTVAKSGIPIPSNSDVQPAIKEFVDPTYNDLHTIPDLPVEETMKIRSNFYTVAKSGTEVDKIADSEKQEIGQDLSKAENLKNSQEPASSPIPPVAKKNRVSKLSETSREVSVPSSRIGRLASYGSLAAGLGIGALAEITRRTLGLNEKSAGDSKPAILDSNPFLTEANAERIVKTLCKVRGAALKLGQMLSIQDNSLINPQLQKIFERVRQSADFMPVRQMERVLIGELGSDWRNKLLDFQDKPFAAASVGQVHLATLLDGREVAMKIQYPGVAKGIESDINNLVAVMNVWNILPKGMYIAEFVEVAKRELSWEVDYVREAECTKRFKSLIKDMPSFKVPDVIDELCTGQIFTSEFVEGISMEQCMELDQETRNYVAENILSLCLTELFEFRFMQTDPNWANFMYNPVTRQIVLIDFGASRDYSKEFVDKYIRVIEGAAEGDRKKVLEYSQALGFLAGYESKAMEEAHVEAVMILGEAFRYDRPFDFGQQDTTRRIQRLIPVMLSQRLCPPPQESYSLHRKMSGAFLLCAKLRANINCKKFFNEITEKYHALGDS